MTRFNQITGVNNNLLNFGFASTIVLNVLCTSATKGVIAAATDNTCARVRFGECDAVTVPSFMAERRAVESRIMGRVPRGSVAPRQAATVSFRVRVLVWILVMAVTMEVVVLFEVELSLCERTVLARREIGRSLVNCILSFGLGLLEDLLDR